MHALLRWLARPGRRRPPAARLEECEPRILYSADLNPALWMAPPLAAEVRAADPAAPALQPAQQQVLRHEIVFVDARVPDAQALLAGIDAAHPDAHIDVVRIDATRDGLQQISDALAGRHDIAALHVISHGQAGLLELGSGCVDAAAVQAQAAQLAAWKNALAPGADLLLYGCDVAAGAQGQDFIARLAAATGTDVAASTDPTGSAARRGDWALEARTGSIETALLPTAAAEQAWNFDLGSYVVTRTGDDVLSGTLRWAITQANANAGADTISFNIAGSGVHTILLSSALPQITDTVTIDGYTQTGASANTASVGTNAQLKIEIDGTFAGGVKGLVLFGAGSSGSTIRGLVVDHIQAAGDTANFGYGIWLKNSSNNTIAGNFVGTNAAGTAAAANQSLGITVDGGSGNTIGGLALADRNLVSGNQASGIWINSDSNRVLGNYVGTNALANASIANSWDGVTVFGGVGNRIGGAQAGAGNVIAWNLDDGIEVSSTAGNSLLGNRIVGNASLGIDLGPNDSTPTPNDVGDTDTGANNLQNFPVLSSANSNSAGTTIVGALDSNANTSYRIEFFSTRPALVTKINGEGERYLGFVNVTTNGAGHAAINTTLQNSWVNGGDSVTATATVRLGGGNYGDSSEFAANVVATSSGVVVVDTVSDTQDGDTSSIANLGANRGGDGRISLREAINATNNTGNGATPDRIVFAIDGQGVQTITPTSSLPSIQQALVIDGSTQPFYARSPLVAINGGSAGAADGLTLAAGSDGSTIRGLLIQGFNSNGNAEGIRVSSSGNLIAGNWLGLNSTGSAAVANYAGISVDGSGNTVGGTTALDRNVISGNAGFDVNIDGAAATNNVVIGNYIGSDATGSVGLGASLAGVRLNNNVNGSRIGGTAAGEGNLITGINGVGIGFVSGLSDAVFLGNSIYGNAGLGIDLNNDGITPNDFQDLDGGPNALRNFPVLASASADASGTTLVGSYNTTPGSTSRIEFFANRPSVADASNGEGERYIGFTTVTADANGDSTFNVLLSRTWVNAGDRITAIATADLGGGVYVRSSEFAANVVATANGVVLVDTTSDTADGNTGSIAALGANRGADGRISLREAITAANNTAGSDLIVFDIPGATTDGVHVIAPASVLPSVTTTLTIDGTSAPDYTGTPVIALDGGGSVQDGLRLYGGPGGSTVRGLLIQNFTQDGIDIASSNGNTVAGNWIGLDSTGTEAAGNQQGVNIWDANNNQIGGSTAADRNVISGNSGTGIWIGTDNGSSTGNRVQGNYVGTDASGMAAVGNSNLGVAVNSAVNTIGGSLAGQGNVISGTRSGAGLLLTTNALATWVAGNLVGLNAAGTAALGNATDGIQVASALNLFGGTTALERNVISGNGASGILLTGAGATGNVVIGNYIGTDITGLADVNGTAAVLGQSGVVMTLGASGNRIGTDADGSNDSAERNVISGNNWCGVEMLFGGTTGNVVQGNYIGTDRTGLAALGNGLEGVSFWGGASGNAAGSGLAGAGNVISGNATGVNVASGSFNNKVQGNLIGLGADGSTVIGNGGVGVQMYRGASAAAVTGNLIGTDGDGNNDSGERNVISGNQTGILLTDAEVTGNTIAGNYIGTDASGLAARGNTTSGIAVASGAHGNLIGGALAAQANVIAGNALHGVWIDGEATDGNIVKGNRIGVNATGTAVLANGSDGIFISNGADATQVGGAAAGEGNWIAGGLIGVEVAGASTGTLIQGNRIGTDLAGTAVWGTLREGVALTQGASGTQVGGTAAGAGNVIAYSGQANGATDNAGVLVNDPASVGNTILGNSIYGSTGLGIDLANNGITANDNGDADAGPNNLQNFPVLTLASTDGAGLFAIAGQFRGIANSYVRLEFFANATQGSGGYGQGRRYLGWANIGTGGTGSVGFGATLAATLNVGEYVSATATATDASYSTFGDTSEFARNVVAVSSAQATITVDTTSDVSDGNTASLSTLLANKGADGVVSLREAITAANNTANGSAPDRITFGIGSGSQVIPLTSTLPTVTEGLVIDGSSQPGYGGAPLVIVDGNQLAGIGLELTSSAQGGTVRGLVLRDFTSHAVQVDAGSSGNTIDGNYIGSFGSGGVDLGASEQNVGSGIFVAGSNNTIGGTTAASRNVIGGNQTNGIDLFGAGATGNLLLNNYIGLDATGAAAVGNAAKGIQIWSGAASNTVGAVGYGNVISGNLGNGIFVTSAAGPGNLIIANRIGTDKTGGAAVANGQDGIWINGTTGTTIGGASAGQGNLISGNAGRGVYLKGDGNTVQGNVIGLDATGSFALANSVGVSINASGNLVGGTGAGEGNRIAGNTQAGVDVLGGTGNAILGNAISGNGGLGIDLGAVGVTANDAADADTGPNDLLNKPVLTSANAATDGQLLVTGTLDGLASAHFRVEFFASAVGDASGSGEGQRYLGFANVDTDALGHATFSATLNGPVATGEAVSATATQTDAAHATFGSTSEFAVNAAAVAMPIGDVVMLPGVASGSVLGYYGFADPAALGHTDVAGAAAMTLSGAPTQTTTADGTGALLLAGGASGQYGEIAGITTGGAMTVAASVRFDSTANWQRIIDFGEANSTGVGNLYVGRFSNSNDLTFTLERDVGGGNYVTDRATAAGAIVNGNWFHFAATVDASGHMALYVNGSLVATQNGQVLATTVRSHNYVGKSNWAPDSLFAGAIDNLVVTQGALSASQVSALYQQVGGLVLPEGAANGTVVGTAVGIDPDASHPISYTLTDDAGGRFAINGTNGTVTVANGSLLDREAAASHDIVVRATDSSGVWREETYTIALTDVNEFATSPVADTDAAANQVAENAANGSLVGITASASDADATTNAITYTLDDSAGGRFAIDANTGVVTVADGTLLDREAAASHGIVVRATSADGSFSTQGYTIALTDVNEFATSPVADTDAAANQVAENAASGTAVGITVSAFDSDATTNTITYTLDDSAGGRFAIDANSGVVTVADGTLLDREAAASHGIVVRATSADGSFATQGYTIALTDVNEFAITPVADVDAVANQVTENAANGTAVGITASAFDNDATTNAITYTLDDSAGGRFAIDANTGVVTVADGTLLDREAAASHGIIVRATSADGSFATQGYTIALTDVNEFATTPVADTDAAANQVAENAANGSLVGITASAFDNDATTNTITYTLDDSAGGRFAIDANSGVVTVADGTLLDREAAASHGIVVRATSADGSFSTQGYTIALTDVNEFAITPVADVDAVANQVTENAANGTAVGITASAFDNDATTNAITYTLDDSAGGRFAIDANTGVVTVADGTLLDREAAASHGIIVRATSADGSFATQGYTIALTDVNEFATTPVADTDAAANQVAENAANGSLVGITASAFDNDATTNSITYTLDDSAGGRFAIDANTGVVTVADGTLLDREAAASHGIVVRATSADGSFSTQGYTIALTDVNEFAITPVADTDATANRVAENAANGTLVGITASASDADATTNAITYTLDDSASGRFAIDANTGVVTVADGTLLDREAAASHGIVVRATSADGSFSTQGYTIALSDVNEFAITPVADVDAVANQVTENAASGTAVGITVSAFDNDATTNTIAYTLDDSASGRFAIDANTGVVTVADGTLLDREAAASHGIVVRATSADGSFSTQGYTIALSDVNEFAITPVADVDAVANQVTENAASGTAVGITASAFDNDATTNTIAYTLDDSAGGRFAIDANTGVVTVADGTLLDREAAASHGIIVRATSADGSFSTQGYTIALTDVNEFAITPVADTDATANRVAENAANGTLVGITAQASDADATTNTITYTLDDSAGGRFAIDANSGVVTVADGTLLDREAAASHDIIVRATSADGSFSTQGYTIALSDVNEFAITPVADVDAVANQVTENAANGTAVGITASAFDNDATTNSITYTLDDSAGGRFAIDANTGVVTVADGTLLDREAAASHGIVVRATSADGSFSTQGYTIALTDVNEFATSPVADVDAVANQVAENAANGTAVGITASASDADATTNTITYTLDDSAGGRFAIDANSGVVTVADGTLLDREAAASHGIIVRATSADGSFSTQGYTIALTDVNEFAITPVADTDATANRVAENAANGTLVGITAQASDADATTNAVTYTLDNDAGGRFAIDANTGVVTVADGTLLDREAAASHGIVVRATSSDGSFATQGYTIALLALNDNDPVITSDGGGAQGAVTAPENQTHVTQVVATDADQPAQTLGFSIIGGADAALFVIDSGSGTLAFRAAPDFEAPADADHNGVYEVTLQVSDGAGRVATQALHVSIVNVNEAPTAAPVAQATVRELSSAGTFVAQVVAHDVDAGDTLTYALVDDAGGRFAIDTATGRVSVADGTRLNVVAQTAHELRVRITDAQGLGVEQMLHVALTERPSSAPPSETPVPGGAGGPTPPPAAEPAVELRPKTPVASGSAQVQPGPARADAASAQADPFGTGLDARRADATPAPDEAVPRGAAPQRGRSTTDAERFQNDDGEAIVLVEQDETIASTTGGLLRASARRGADAADEVLASAATAPSEQSGDDVQRAASVPVRVAGAGLSAGLVWWLTRSGGLLTSILMGIPAWRHIDLLPVVARRDEDDEAAALFDSRGEATQRARRRSGRSRVPGERDSQLPEASEAAMAQMFEAGEDQPGQRSAP